MKQEGSRLILLIGYIGAGKSTYSQKLWKEAPETTLRVCMDEIIQMASFYDFQPALRSLYRGEEAHMILRGLALGLDVIVDRTNLERRTRATYLQMGRRLQELARLLLDTLDSPDLFGSPPSQVVQQWIVEWTQDLEDGLLYQQALLYAYQQYEWSSPPLFPSSLPQTYRDLLVKIAHLKIVGIHFDVPPDLCLKRRLEAEDRRLRERMRPIHWEKVLQDMIRRFEPPTLEEGFDELWILDENFEKKAIYTSTSASHR